MLKQLEKVQYKTRPPPVLKLLNSRGGHLPIALPPDPTSPKLQSINENAKPAMPKGRSGPCSTRPLMTGQASHNPYQDPTSPNHDLPVYRKHTSSQRYGLRVTFTHRNPSHNPTLETNTRSPRVPPLSFSHTSIDALPFIVRSPALQSPCNNQQFSPP